MKNEFRRIVITVLVSAFDALVVGSGAAYYMLRGQVQSAQNEKVRALMTRCITVNDCAFSRD